jgi:hypothetical protein
MFWLACRYSEQVSIAYSAGVVLVDVTHDPGSASDSVAPFMAACAARTAGSLAPTDMRTRFCGFFARKLTAAHSWSFILSPVGT